MIENWPDEPEFRITRRMWTTSQHVITCSMILIFASIFRSENALTYDSQQLRHYAQVGRDFIRDDEPLSSIARRGARLLDALISFDATATDSLDIELEIRDMIRRVAIADGSATAASSQQSILSGVYELWIGFLGEADLSHFNG